MENKESFQGFKTPEEEVEFLRSYIKEREGALPQNEKNPTSLIETAKAVVQEYASVPTEHVLAPEAIVASHESDAIVLRLSPETHDSKIEELFGMLMHNGLKNTLSVVEKMNDPHIDDDFHRFLIQYLQNGTVPDLKEGTPIAKALHMKLFEIVLPEPGPEEKKTYKELIASMEQLYAGLQAIADGRDNKGHDYFTLEVAEQNSNSHVVFYASVPSTKADLFEKQVLASLPKARVIEKPDDYNIFTNGGVNVGATAELTAHSAFPLRTFDKLENDPMHAILSAFSKLKDSGEGAAIQFVIAPAGEKYIKDFTYALSEVKKGVKIEKKGRLLDGFDSVFMKVGKEILSGKSQTPEEKEKERMEKEKNIDQQAIEFIGEKIKHTVYSANIRIAASAADGVRAKQILHEIKSAFNQFTEPLSNSINFRDVSEKGLKQFFHEFSYRFFDDKEVMPLNLRELTSMFHFPWGIGSAPQLKSASAVEAPAPHELTGNAPGTQEGALIGVNRYRGLETPIHFNPEDRLRHFYVIGQTGTGKTTLLKNMIVQDIKAGHGVCFIDPHGTDIQDIMAQIPRDRIDDVIYFDPASTARPMGLNMLEYDTRFPEQKTFVVDEMLSIFRKLFGAVPESMGPAFEQYFRNACLLIMEDTESGATILEIGRVLADKPFRDAKLAKCKNPIIHQFWTAAEKTTGDAGLANYVPYITNKFDVFVTNEIMRPIIAQEKSAFNFREIMDTKKIFLVNMSKGRLGEINANLIGLIIVGKILMAALSRVDSFGKDLPPFYLYIDEFQNVTTNSISQILSEARKYKLGLTIAHQFIAQLEEGIKNAVFGNVGSIAAFRVGVEDAEFLAKQFDPVFTAQDIIKIENRNAYMKMLVRGMPVKPFSMATLAPDPGVPDIVDKLKELSYLKYGEDRATVDDAIMRRYTSKL
ncbi:MAG: TraM recognition domain-containing protein [Candidatus Pacebacteria bacterium]|nr:TraM recognition domain-containing protein [Candidatus Paceibacterota bacterium]